ncbi:hypothetical protein QJS66_12020 [Kocuria rhizophila]|nr:hypothetical protein QJS66_12020 [Kocuria rhizophila]
MSRIQSLGVAAAGPLALTACGGGGVPTASGEAGGATRSSPRTPWSPRTRWFPPIRQTGGGVVVHSLQRPGHPTAPRARPNDLAESISPRTSGPGPSSEPDMRPPTVRPSLPAVNSWSCRRAARHPGTSSFWSRSRAGSRRGRPRTTMSG